MLTPQDTSVAILRDTKLKTAITQANILEPLYTAYEGDKFRVLALVAGNPRYKGIRTFTTPIAINNSDIVIDIRSGVRGDTTTPTPEQMPYFNLVYGITQGLWMNGHDNSMINRTDTLTKIYGYWISDILSRHYQFDVDDKALVGIIASAFYLSKRATEIKFDDTLRAQCLRKLNRLYSAAFITQALAHIPLNFSTYDDLVTALIATLGEEKLAGLNALVLMRYVSINISGLLNSDIIFATAVEYPPAFITLVLLIARNTFLQKSNPLGRTVANLLTGRTKDELLKEFKFF